MSYLKTGLSIKRKQHYPTTLPLIIFTFPAFITNIMKFKSEIKTTKLGPLHIMLWDTILLSVQWLCSYISNTIFSYDSRGITEIHFQKVTMWKRSIISACMRQRLSFFFYLPADFYANFNIPFNKKKKMSTTQILLLYPEYHLVSIWKHMLYYTEFCWPNCISTVL